MPRNRVPRIIRKLQTKRQKEPGETTEAIFWICQIRTRQQVAQPARCWWWWWRRWWRNLRKVV